MKNPVHARLSLHFPTLSLCAFLAALPALAPAADTTWSGLSGGGSQWGDGANWSGGVPSGTSRAVFGTGFGSGSAVTLGAATRDAASLSLDTTQNFSLEGGTVRLATGGLTRAVASSGNHFIYTPLQFSLTNTSNGAPAVWDVQGSDALYLYGNVTTAGRPWEVHAGPAAAGTAPFWFGGVCDGALSVTGEMAFFGGAQTVSLQAASAGLTSSGSPLKVSGSAETTLTNSALRGLNLSLAGGSLRENGSTFTNNAGVIMAPPANAIAQVLGDGLTGLGFFTKNGAGTVRLETTSPTAVETTWFYAQAGTVDLDGHTLRVAGPGSGDATLTLQPGFTLQDSGSGGKLRLEYMTLQNSGATFSGTPDITFAPPSGVFAFVQGNAIMGPGGEPAVGELRVEGAGVFWPATYISAESVSLASGPIWQTVLPVLVQNQATFEAGSTVNNVGNPWLEMRGGQLRNNGVTLTNRPGLIVNNPANRTVTIAGSAPLTGLGGVSKQNSGALVLQQNVQATSLDWAPSGGTVDLNDHTFTVSGPAGSGVTLNLNSGSTLTDSGTGGTLRFERADLRNNGAAFSDTPNMTFAPPADVQAVVQGNAITGPGGVPALGRLRVEGAGVFRAVTPVAAEEFSLASGPVFQAWGVPFSFSSSVTLESGSRIEGFGGVVALEMRGGQFLNNGAILQNFPSFNITNPFAQPVTLGGTAALTGVGTLNKNGAGALVLQQNVQTTFLSWGTSGGTIDLNDHSLTVSGPAGQGHTVFLRNGSTLTDSGTNGVLRFERADLNNNGANFSNAPNLTFAPAADVFALIQGAAITGPAGAPALGHLRIEGAGALRPVTPVSVEQFLLAAGPVFQAAVPVAVRDLATLDNQSVVNGLGGYPMLEMRGGQLLNNGATLVNSPALIVNNVAAQPVTIGGSAALSGLGSLQKAGPGALILDRDVSAASLQHSASGGAIDLHGHVLETAGGGVLAAGSTLVNNGVGGSLRVTGGSLFVQDGSNRAGSPDLTLAAPALQTATLTTDSLIAGGFGTLVFSGAGTGNFTGNIGASRAEFLSGTAQFGATLFVEDEAVLGPAATLTGSSISTSLFLNSGRVRSDGATINGSFNLSLSSNSFSGSSIEGSAPLSGLYSLSISGTGHTDIRVGVNTTTAVFSGGEVDLHGQTLFNRNMALNGGVRVMDSGGGASVISYQGDPIVFGEGRCEVPITTTSGARKTGNNIMTLAASSPAFFGDVIIQTGFLVQAADLSTGGAPVQVGGGAVYSGRGRVGGTLTLLPEARLVPGNPNTVSTGVLTIAQPLTLSAGAVLDFDLGTPVTGSDRLVLESSISGPATGKVTVNISRAPGYTNNGTAYVLLDLSASGGTGLSLSQFTLGYAPALGTLAIGPGGATLIFQPAVDADGDGLLDSWEITNFGNLTTASSTSDVDHDGLSDLQEYAGGFDPNDPASRLEILDFLHDAPSGLSAVRFTSRPGHLYREESSVDLETWYFWTATEAVGNTTITPYSGNITDDRSFRRILAVPPEI